MLPFNDYKQVYYFAGHDVDQSRLYQRWSLKNELKLLKLQRRKTRQATPATYATDLETAPIGR